MALKLTIHNLSNYADILAVPCFGVLSIYFYNINNKTILEKALFLFSVMGFVLDILYSYIFVYGWFVDLFEKGKKKCLAPKIMLLFYLHNLYTFIHFYCTLLYTCLLLLYTFIHFYCTFTTWCVRIRSWLGGIVRVRLGEVQIQGWPPVYWWVPEEWCSSW